MLSSSRARTTGVVSAFALFFATGCSTRSTALLPRLVSATGASSSGRAKVKIGQRLIIPRAPALLLARRPNNPPPVTGFRSVDAVVTAGNTAPDAGRTRQASLIYRVKRGDTLFGIARLYRTAVASLKT